MFLIFLNAAMLEYYLFYIMVVLAFMFGFYWNSRREKVSAVVENDTQIQMEGILEMNRENIQSLGFH